MYATKDNLFTCNCYLYLLMIIYSLNLKGAKNMQTISLLDNEINKYPIFYKGKSHESNIREYSDTELIKIFKSYNENKIYTLELMERHSGEFKLVEELLIHKGIITNYIHPIGLLIDKGYETNGGEYFTQENISFNDKIIVLQNIGKVLKKLNILRNKEHILETFFISDLQEKNILIDAITKKVQYIDLDSCKIDDNYPFLTRYLHFYNTWGFAWPLRNKYPFTYDVAIPNQNTELYSYIVIILKFLFDVDIIFLDIGEFYEQMYTLKEQGLPESLFQIFLKLYDVVPNENPYKVLDTIPSSFERKKTLK